VGQADLLCQLAPALLEFPLQFLAGLLEGRLVLLLLLLRAGDLPPTEGRCPQTSASSKQQAARAAPPPGARVGGLAWHAARAPAGGAVIADLYSIVAIAQAMPGETPKP
jgi:hypothetical protein